jgi:hypothetical protein
MFCAPLSQIFWKRVEHLFGRLNSYLKRSAHAQWMFVRCSESVYRVSVSRCLHFNIGFILKMISRCSVSAHRKYNPYRLMTSCSSAASLEIIINISCCQAYLHYDPLHLLFQNRSHCQWMFCCSGVYRETHPPSDRVRHQVWTESQDEETSSETSKIDA